jgi:hypothetical protein
MFIILEHIAYKQKSLVCDWSSCSSGLVEAAYYLSIIANMGNQHRGAIRLTSYKRMRNICQVVGF